MPYPLSTFAQGYERLTVTCSSDPLIGALKTMADNDFSQLPVIGKDGALCGMLSERSILRAQYYLGKSVTIWDGVSVADFQEDAVALDSDSDIFDALERLNTTPAVVIVENSHPIGILTDYDATEFFRELFEGLIWARDIELTLREYIDRAFPETTKLDSALARAFGMDRRDASRPAREYNRLTLGEHIQLVMADENWSHFHGVFEPKPVFRGWMEQVRDIRNNIAHVRSQPGNVELDAVRRAYNWLQNRPQLPDPRPAKLETADSVAASASVQQASESQSGRGSIQGKYGPLYNWLLDAEPYQARIRLTFEGVEKIIGESLPPGAMQHRYWWANDSVGHVQSKAWLKAGWRVVNVDFAQREVTFQRDGAHHYEDEGEVE